MSNLCSYLMIIGSIIAMFVLLWLLDLALAEENQRRRDELREMQRECKRRENLEWYINTRAEYNRADLFRSYAEMEVQDDRA